jgi:MoxR-like ATPase
VADPPCDTPAPDLSRADPRPSPPPVASETDAALFARLPDLVACITSRVHATIVGQDQAVRVLLAAILAEGHVLLVGVPGLAKTLLVRALADALGWRFSRIQFTPDLMPSDVVGSELLQETAAGPRTMRFVPGPVFTNLLLADEINRTPPRTQSALLEAMQERTVTSLGRSHRIDPPFIVVATQNPIEQEGTYPLPEAQLDRFMFSLRLDYPTLDHERRIALHARHEPRAPRGQAPAIADIHALQHLTARVPVTDAVRDYAVALVRATRPEDPTADEFVRRCVLWGAGPRGSQHLVLAARALALLDRLPTPAPRHVREAAPWVLGHRIVPSYTAASEDIDAPAIVAHVLDRVAEPRP